MIVYWLMFAVPAIKALTEQRKDRAIFSPLWLFVMLALATLIGFRWETGGDWSNYYRMVEDVDFAPDGGSLSDPGFALIVHLASKSSAGIVLVTAISGLMMGVALTRFCLNQPRPWLCMAVAIPYLVVVMGMGYIRQGMAISCLMMGLSSIGNGRVVRYSLWVLAGALFHSTVLIMLPLGVLISNRNALLRVGLALLTAIFLFYGMHSARTETLMANYVQSEMSSSGAAIRLGMTALPGAVFLYFRKRFGLNPVEQGVWSLLSGAAILGLMAFFVSPSSTVIDRLGLYLLPVQCFVYSRLPGVLGQNPKNERAFVVAILSLYTLIFFVWLNFANNANMWLPYRFYWLEDGICLEC